MKKIMLGDLEVLLFKSPIGFLITKEALEMLSSIGINEYKYVELKLTVPYSKFESNLLIEIRKNKLNKI